MPRSPAHAAANEARKCISARRKGRKTIANCSWGAARTAEATAIPLAAQQNLLVHDLDLNLIVRTFAR